MLLDVLSGLSGVVASFTLSTSQELITKEASMSLLVLIVSVLASLCGRDGSHAHMCVVLVDRGTMRSELEDL